MPETISPTINYEMVSKNYGHFVIEPLEPGYGLTLGNAMRRILLSSLIGAAITAVRIDGVQHEFSTIPHMKEDTLEFLLNVKGIRLKRLVDRSDTLTLEASGEKEIKAGDIKPSATFEIVNPEHHLAILDSADANLNVEFTVELGKGYITAGPNENRSIGVLPMDAVFTPIRRVNYKVEKTRVEDRSDYDKLILDVWTDGTIAPDDAVSESARILMQQFANFANLGKLASQPVALDEDIQSVEEHDMPLEQLGLSSRTLNALRRGGISTTSALLLKSRDELLGLKNFGIKSWNEVQEQLVKMELIESSEYNMPEVEEEDKSAEEQAIEEMRKRLQEKFQVREDR